MKHASLFVSDSNMRHFGLQIMRMTLKPPIVAEAVGMVLFRILDAFDRRL